MSSLGTAHLLRADEALQQTVDALAELVEVDAFVPAILRIVGRAFGEDCAFYEHRSVRPRTRLRYWLRGGRVLRSDELVALSGEYATTVRLLVEGFDVEEGYLGRNVHARTQATVLDHRAGTTRPEFDAFAVAHDWDNELNVPLLVRGAPAGALVVYRGPGRTFSPEDIALGETLGKQLALACAASRAASEVREAARASERAEAADRRADELERANFALARSTSQLVSPASLPAFLETVVAEAIAATGAVTGAVFLVVPASRTMRLEAMILRGRTVDVASDASVRPWRAVPLELPASASIVDHFSWRDYPKPAEPGDHDRALDWHRAHRHGLAPAIALSFGDEVIGFLGLAYDEAVDIVPAHGEALCRSLAQHCTLAVRLATLAEGARDAASARAELAVAEERVRAAEGLRRRGELLAVLAEESRSLLEAGTPDEGVPRLIARVGRAAGLHRVVYWRVSGEGAGETGYRVAAEWCAPGFLDHATAGVTHLSEQELGAYARALRERTSVWGRLDAFDPAVARRFGPLAIVATGYAPIVVAGRVEGVLSFDDCVAARAWDDAEVEALTAAANLVGAALQSQALREQVAAERSAEANRRAEQLERANQALARSLDGLVTAGQLPAFLDRVLVEAVAASGAVSGAVFVHTPETDTLEAVSFLLRGVLVDVASDPRVAPFRAPIPASTGEPWRVMSDERRLFWVDYGGDAPDPRDWPQSWSWHRQHRHRFVACMPMLLAGAAVGFLGLCFDVHDVVAPDVPRLELVRLLAQHATLALHVSRLGEADRRASLAHARAAAARDREAMAQERAEEMDRVNRILLESSETLSRATTPQEILEVFLVHAVRVSQAAAGAILRRVGETEHVFVALVSNGSVVPEREWADMPMVLESSSTTAADGEGVIARVVRGEQVLLSVDDTLARWAPAATSFHREHGHRSVLVWPFRVTGRTAGYLGLASREDDPQIARETLRALSSQASLALELNAMMEKAEQAAAAREREVAAQDRATQLARANEALRQAADALVGVETSDEALAVFLRRAVEVVGAADGAVLRRTGSTSFEFVAVLERERWVTGDELALIPMVRAIREVSERDPLGHFARLSRGEVGFFPITSENAASWYPEAAAWHRQRGNRATWDIPFALRGRVAGYIGLAFDDVHRPSAADEETVTALANQMSVALEMIRLGDEARSVAVAHERARAAQTFAAEVTAANEAIRRGVERVAADEGLDALLGALLLEAIHVVGARGGAVTDVNGDRWCVRVVVQAGAVISPADWRREPFFRELPEVLARQKERFTAQALETPIQRHGIGDTRRWWPVGAEYHARQGHDEVWVLPCVLRGEVRANLVLGFAVAAVVDDLKRSTLTTLTQQITVALELEQARDRAVARAEERAARDRAVAIERIGEAGRAVLERLADAPALDSFLGDVLRTAAEQYGAIGASFFLWSAADSVTELFLSWDPVGGVRPGDADGPAPRVPLAPLPRGQVTAHREPDFDGVYPPFIPLLRAAGVRSALCVPLYLGESYRGVMTFVFQHNRVLSHDEEQLGFTLANQAVLAMELTRLAETAREDARQGAMLQERNRIAREIHDTLAQSLAAVLQQLEATQGGIDAGRSHTQERIALAATLAREGLVEARRSIRALRPSALERGDLFVALRGRVGTLSGKSTARIELTREGEPFSLPHDVESEFLRIAEEALTNAVRHAGAAHIDVVLSYEESRNVRITVSDDGRGFDPDCVSGAGVGLTGTRERAARIGAELTFSSEPENGTDVILFWRDPRVPGETP